MVTDFSIYIWYDVVMGKKILALERLMRDRGGN